jgi:hypothetical protein
MALNVCSSNVVPHSTLFCQVSAAWNEFNLQSQPELQNALANESSVIATAVSRRWPITSLFARPISSLERGGQVTMEAQAFPLVLL